MTPFENGATVPNQNPPSTSCKTLGAQPEEQGLVQKYRDPGSGSVPVHQGQHSQRPTLAPEALHGPVGELVRVLAPTTEADEAALLTTALTMFGAMCGDGAHVRAGGDHRPALFTVVTGATSAARKGTSLTAITEAMRLGFGDELDRVVRRGIGSGEALIHAIRDPRVDRVPIYDGKGETKRFTGEWREEPADPGASEKRALIEAEEFAALIAPTRRQGSTLSPKLREAWDGRKLEVGTKASPDIATGYHLAVLGHVTAEELQELIGSIDLANGLANRCLWVLSHRSQFLPEPPPFPAAQLDPIVRGLADAAQAARVAGDMVRDADARTLWADVYPMLERDRPGAMGKVCGRSSAQTLRLALIYALADQAAFIERPHLEAALAVWNYCEATAGVLFGSQSGQPLPDRILSALRAAGTTGATRSTLHRALGNHASAHDLGTALERLAEDGLAVGRTERTGGRPSERWWTTDALHEREVSEESERTPVTSLSSLRSHDDGPPPDLDAWDEIAATLHAEEAA
ncbi:MAG: YfjI family protein [Solirubrobacteraceae bacterium]|nr:YfjI family protein [Solirubrobacteraceae bacterium]